MTSRLLLFLVAAFCSLSSYSQSIFEFDYHFDIDNTREQYKAFMLRNDDGTGFMRIRYHDQPTNAWIIVDLQMQEHYMGDEDHGDNTKTDSTILVFEGYDPQIISGPKDIQYDPDIFIFQFSEKTGNYEPISVISEDENHIEHEGVINEVKLLNEEDLTKDLMATYFTEKDEVYKNVVEEAQVRSVAPQQQPTKLHLIIVANTDDISIGGTCAVDKDATYKTFSTLADFLGLQFVPKVIAGKDFTKVNVDNAVRDLQPAKNDIVIFYYSGHGFSNVKDNNRFPYLDLRDKTSQEIGGPYTINIENIFGSVKSKGARLNLVISDCCNSDPSLSNVTTGDLASTRHSSVGWNINNCRALFMNNKPMSVLVTAASKGELSAGNSTGGIFTFNFRETMEKSFGPFFNMFSWDQVLKTSKDQTIKKAKNTWCVQPDNSRQVCVQNPVYKVE